MSSRTNLPPGVLARDLDPKMVECPNPLCDEGQVHQEDDNGTKWTDRCPTCEGQGEVPASEQGG